MPTIGASVWLWNSLVIWAFANCCCHLAGELMRTTKLASAGTKRKGDLSWAGRAHRSKDRGSAYRVLMVLAGR